MIFVNNKTILVIPPFTASISLGEDWELTPVLPDKPAVLLLCHPINRIVRLYESSKTRMDFKIWLFSSTPRTARSYCKEIEKVVRVEDNAIKGLSLLPQGRTNVCLASKSFIRERYKEEYEIGEYE